LASRWFPFFVRLNDPTPLPTTSGSPLQEVRARMITPDSLDDFSSDYLLSDEDSPIEQPVDLKSSGPQWCKSNQWYANMWIT
jgi:hypothetical protein